MAGPLPQTSSVPPPRRAPDRDGDEVRRWYEDELGWPTAPGTPPRLRLGVRFDVLDVPAQAGRAALRHLGPASPVALRAGRMRVLVAAGSAPELPGLLDWLEWGPLAGGLDLRMLGEGAVMEAPARGALGAGAEQGAAVWLRPPGPGCEVEASLPTVSAVGGVGGAPDLVRVLATVATECHRLRLRRVCAQPLAFS
ncbi:SCO3374 family protein [Streptomyces sp. NPDC006610]|jgi:hypothetical protein|uniref:SCO3374 family protein n=1 Tax=Streptomyces sp. NPDC006610 TaxID=3154584 RepID=UPI0033A176DA